MDLGDVAYMLVGASVLLPLGARIGGNGQLAKRLDILPRISFGLVSLIFSLLPDSTFQQGFHRVSGSMKPLSGYIARPIFIVVGLFLIGTAIRAIMTKNYDLPDQD